jgi:NAD-dependent SIR2 family protein deacetylase
MTHRFVPSTSSDLSNLSELASLVRYMDVTVLTGAGCSTESGIPDYRGPETRDTHPEPITYREFVDQPESRRRYWARATVGWPRFKAAEPNDAHRAIARLEREGFVRGIITQNVDRLHQRAGSRRVVELHGALAEVECLECGDVLHRDEVQSQLLELNPELGGTSAPLRPDGDAHLPEGAPEGFTYPDCPTCNGVLKPNVVFFGEDVDDACVGRAWDLFYESEVLLVVGSSLEVWSGYRFVRRAAERRMPVGIVNLGETRGDDDTWIKIEARVGEAMPRLADMLAGSRHVSSSD